MIDLLLATHNEHKITEYRSLLAGLPYRVASLSEQGITMKAPESGATFEENAIEKARIYAPLSRLPTLAEDSGLEVEALGGEPGVLSARYAGENASDADRVRFLLDRMKDIPLEKRRARFRCVIALIWPGNGLEVFNGECRGVIAFEPRGSLGFGYDPVFFLPEFGKTMAEVSAETKNQISHRASAVRKARQFLERRATEGILR
ncbi:MAG: XTP/dITP diphosphatase [Chloroflexi bacterium]|nr:XTP/dITP diphosphatase [Chloroflexota bacterium]